MTQICPIKIAYFAIKHWEKHTIIRFAKRTNITTSKYPNYVRFVPSTGCSSSVGMRGGRQYIRLSPLCTLGNTIHEIGHTVGLWHKQSREDRNKWITINYEHISTGRSHNFDQHISGGDDIGSCDYASIMHYNSIAFSKDGQKTITAKNDVSIGQRLALSARDIAAVWQMYHKLIKGEQRVATKYANGSTTPGATNWIQHHKNGIYVDIDTSSAEFKTIPKYFTSLVGKRGI